jgi:TetR/AcrR family acrAB operon transcriptional repressor
MVRRTKEEALATRNRILDAAEMLFERQGVSRTTLNDIAEAAEVTRGAIYWHFKDKGEVFEAMMERASMPFEEGEGCSQRQPDEDPIAWIEASMLRVLRVTATHERTRRVFEIATHKVEYVDELLKVRDRRLECRSECLADVERALKTAMAQGRIPRQATARSLAIGVHSLVDGLTQNWMLDPKAFDLVKVGRQVIRTYIAGLTLGAEQPEVRRVAAGRKVGVAGTRERRAGAGVRAVPPGAA